LDGSCDEEEASAGWEEDGLAGVALLAASLACAGSVAGATSEFAAGAGVDVDVASAWASMPAGGVVSTPVAHAQEAVQGKNARAAEPTSPTIHDQGTRMLLISIDPPGKASMDSTQSEPRKTG
jgi:predicted phage tail protein